MRKKKLALVFLIISTLLLSSCAEDTAMHTNGMDYLHKESAEEREANVIESQLGLASLGKNLKKHNANFTLQEALQDFANSTGRLGSSTGGSDGVFNQSATLYLPFESGTFTSDYGWRVLHGASEYHFGLDIAMPIGTPLSAPFDGEVVRDALNPDNCSSTAGCTLTLQGKFGNEEVRVGFFHLKSLPSLRVGDRVSRGQVVAYSGNTDGGSGRSTGAHLHLEFMVKEIYTSVGLDANRPKVSSMHSGNDLRAVQNSWWFRNALGWSRVNPKSYFKEFEGISSTGQVIKRSENTNNPTINSPTQPISNPNSQSVSVRTRQSNYKSATGVTTASPSASTVQQPADTLVVVNKMNKLQSSYTPSGMVNVTGLTRSGRTEKMLPVASTALTGLINKAKDAGINVGVRSAYRSYSDQESAFNNNRQDETISARPGYSEHQTGYAVDLVEATQLNLNGSVALSETNQVNQPLYQWLESHAHDHGFIIRYPKDKTNITGYSYEPWHVRYVGVQEAEFLKNNNLTLEEAVEQGKLPLSQSNAETRTRFIV